MKYFLKNILIKFILIIICIVIVSVPFYIHFRPFFPFFFSNSSSNWALIIRNALLSWGVFLVLLIPFIETRPKKVDKNKELRGKFLVGWAFLLLGAFRMICYTFSNLSWFWGLYFALFAIVGVYILDQEETKEKVWAAIIIGILLYVVPQLFHIDFNSGL
jgi:hypothetical protein